VQTEKNTQSQFFCFAAISTRRARPTGSLGVFDRVRCGASVRGGAASFSLDGGDWRANHRYFEGGVFVLFPSSLAGSLFAEAITPVF
jgi:hypothetical protein